MTDSPDASTTSGAPAGRRGRGRRRPSPLTVVGLVLLLAGLGCLGWVGQHGVRYLPERTGQPGRHGADQVGEVGRVGDPCGRLGGLGHGYFDVPWVTDPCSWRWKMAYTTSTGTTVITTAAKSRP